MDCDSQRIWKIVDSNRQNLPQPKEVESHASLLETIHQLYIDHYEKKGQPFRSTVNLIMKLKPCCWKSSFQLYLYDDNSGYSIGFSDDDDEYIQLHLPYEDDDIFKYLDNQMVPPILLEMSKKFEFHNGQVLCEVRNFRTYRTFQTSFLMLHSTSESFTTLSDHKDDRPIFDEVFLESKLLKETQTPVCLDPTTDVTCVNNRLYYNYQKYHDRSSRQNSYKSVFMSHFLKDGRSSTKSVHHGKISRKFTEAWKVYPDILPAQIDLHEAIEDISRIVSPIPHISENKIRMEKQDVKKSIDSIEFVRDSTKLSSATDSTQKPRSLPTLNVFHSKAIAKSNLPKLHPFTSDEIVLGKVCINQQSTSLPQLHRLSSDSND